jgi:hypothetical protein
MSDVDWEIGNSLYDSYKQAQERENQYNSDVEDTNRTYDSYNDRAASDRDYSVNEANNLYNSEIAKLEENYGKATDSLDTSKRNSQQNASITLDKLKKYLPMQIKAQGLGGLGVSESSMLQAYNDYNNTMSDIASDYNTNKTSLETSYNESKSGYDSTRDSAVNSANKLYNDTVASTEESRAQALSDLLKYFNNDKSSWYTETKNNATSIFDKYKTAYENEQTENFNNAYSIISSSTSESADDIMAQFSNLNLSDAQRQQLKALAETKAQNNAKTRADEEAATAKEKEEYDRENAYVVAQATVEELIADGEYDKAKEYLDQNKSTFGDSVYNSYLTSINSKVQQKEIEDAETEQAELDEKIIAGKEYVTYGDNSYKITKELDSSANEIARNNDFKKQLQEVCGTTNPYDSNIPNGTTFEIKCDDSGANDFNAWDDIFSVPFQGVARAIQTGNWGSLFYGSMDSWFNWNTKYVTYYNGKWYLSDKK